MEAPDRVLQKKEVWKRVNLRAVAKGVANLIAIASLASPALQVQAGPHEAALLPQAAVLEARVLHRADLLDLDPVGRKVLNDVETDLAVGIVLINLVKNTNKTRRKRSLGT